MSVLNGPSALAKTAAGPDARLVGGTLEVALKAYVNEPLRVITETRPGGAPAVRTQKGVLDEVVPFILHIGKQSLHFIKHSPLLPLLLLGCGGRVIQTEQVSRGSESTKKYKKTYLDFYH